MESIQTADRLSPSEHDGGAPLLVTFQTACKQLSISAATGYRLIDRKQLDTVLIGRRRLVKAESVRNLAENGTEPR